MLLSCMAVLIPLARVQVAEAPADLMDRRVEITGPVDRKMVRGEGSRERRAEPKMQKKDRDQLYRFGL